MKLALFILLPLFASAQIRMPQLGVFIDSQNRLRILQGLPGALTLAPADSTDEVLSAAASALCIASKTRDSLRVSCAGEPPLAAAAPHGPALFAFHPDGKLAFIYYSETAELLPWPDGPARLFPGVVSLSVRHLLIQRDGALSLYNLSTETELPLPDVTLPAVVLSDGSVLDRSALLPETPSRIEPFAPGLLLLDRQKLFRLRDSAIFDIPQEAPLP